MKLGELRVVVLTLTAPSFELPKPWGSVPYRDLLDECETRTIPTLAVMNYALS